MGVLTDLVIAGPEEAALVATSEPHSPKWPREDLKGLDQITLASLWSQLSGKPFESLELFPCLHSVSDEGPWVYQVPDELVARLAAMAKADTARIAAAWVQTEELQGVDADDAEDVLRVLKALAERTQRERQALLMWVCL